VIFRVKRETMTEIISVRDAHNTRYLKISPSFVKRDRRDIYVVHQKIEVVNELCLKTRYKIKSVECFPDLDW
jgi:hypothetical protein